MGIPPIQCPPLGVGVPKVGQGGGNGLRMII